MNVRVRPRVNIKQYEFFTFKVGRFFGGTFFKQDNDNCFFFDHLSSFQSSLPTRLFSG